MMAAPLLLGDDGYQVQRSLRFRASAGAYLTRAVTTLSNRTTWTYSVWLKRGALGGLVNLFGAGAQDGGNNFTACRISNSAGGTTDGIDFLSYAAGAQVHRLVTAQVFRDPSAWMHLVFVFDTGNATAADRTRIYVNGVRITAFTTQANPALNQIGSVNFNYGGTGHRIATADYEAEYFDGHMAEINFIDGQALTAASFGQTDPLTGAWIAKPYAGAYGTNGFYLDFKDPTTTSSLCLDRSGNGNNWTPNNISVTAGATYDSMIDAPLGAGGGERGNYAVLNPLVKHVSPALAIDANLTVQNSGATSVSQNISGSALASGLVYYELTAWNVGGGVNGAGFSGFAKSNIIYQSGEYPGAVADSFGFGIAQAATWYSRKNGAASTNLTLANCANGDVMMIAYDSVNGNAWVGKNGVWNGTGNPSTGANPDLTGLITGLDNVPSISMINTGSASVHWYANFGQRPFSYTPPTGFKALHTGNLPAPMVRKPASNFDVVLQLGSAVSTGAALLAQFANFVADFAWGKDRSAVTHHQLVDTVRGSTAVLQSNTTSAETTYIAPTAGDACVAWGLKGGGAAVTNNAGTVSSQVSANPAAGFSVVTCTTPGSGAFSVGHGLGIAPAMVIVFNRTTGASHYVYHKGLNGGNPGTSFYMSLESTNGQNSLAGIWGSTGVTSSVVGMTVGSPFAAGQNLVLYCFAEIDGFSKAFSYTGNGLADGVFNFLGFRPRFAMIKRADVNTENWVMKDALRSNAYNPQDGNLYANLSNAEDTAASVFMDFLSNGIKHRGAYSGNNANGGTYHGFAFAETPFKNANAR